MIITAEIIPGAAGPNGGVFEFSIEDPFGDNADPVLVNADPDDVYGSYTFQPMTPGAYQIVVKYTASAGPGVRMPGSGPVKSTALTVTGSASAGLQQTHGRQTDQGRQDQDDC